MNWSQRRFYISFSISCTNVSLIKESHQRMKKCWKMLKNVIRYIKEDYQRQVTVSELAGICHFSEYYFMRFFKKYMNMTCLNI